MVKVSDKNGESDCTMVRTAHITHMKISDKNELQIVYTETLKQVFLVMIGLLFLQKWYEPMIKCQSSQIPLRIDTLKTDSRRITTRTFLSEIFTPAGPVFIRHGQSIVTFLSENYCSSSPVFQWFHSEFLIKRNF